MQDIAFILGTRPEIIKLAPVIIAMRGSPLLRPVVVLTGQHSTMADQALSAFHLVPDVNLELMVEDQSPAAFLSSALAKLEQYLRQARPRACVVQGDTTSALAGALAAFHERLPAAHVEAGLRTHRSDCPFPEEMNRTLVAKLSSIHFCPTERAVRNLAAEGIADCVWNVGNTVVDALLAVLSALDYGRLSIDKEAQELISSPHRILLVTGHRRENFDAPLRTLCGVLKRLRDETPDLRIVYPVHLNPSVQSTIHSELGKEQRIDLLAPLDYPSMAAVMRRAALIITDSGGIQEEAPSLGVPVLVTRAATERPEALEAGCALLTPLDDPDGLYRAAEARLSKRDPMVEPPQNPFGDGHAAERIISVLEQAWAS